MGRGREKRGEMGRREIPRSLRRWRGRSSAVDTGRRWRGRSCVARARERIFAGEKEEMGKKLGFVP